jgi:hypothetical protein
MTYSTHRDLGRKIAELLGHAIDGPRMVRVWREAVRAECVWILRAFSQPWRGHTADTDIVLFYLLHLLVNQQLDICSIDLVGPAGRDDERDRHQSILDCTLSDHGLSAAVDPSQRNADCDGSLSAHEELSGIRFSLRPYDEETYQKVEQIFRMVRRIRSELTYDSGPPDRWIPRYEVGYVPAFIGQPPKQIPLEIGFCDPSRVLYHLVNTGYVARWPRDSQTLHVIITADDPYVAMRMEGRSSLPGYNPWRMGKYDLAEGIRVARESWDAVESSYSDMRKEVASLVWATSDQRNYLKILSQRNR